MLQHYSVLVIQSSSKSYGLRNPKARIRMAALLIVAGAFVKNICCSTENGVVENIKSKLHKSTIGVPQGSVLRPILFNVYFDIYRVGYAATFLTKPNHIF